MQAFARAPNQMSNKGPMDKNWKIFKEQFLTFMKVTEGNLEASDKQAIMLLNLMGEVGQEALQNIPFNYPEEKEDIQILLEKFDEYFDPPKKESNERYAFFTRTRKPNESIENFIAGLQEKAKTCNFDSLADSLIRDKVILDTKDKLLRKLLLDTEDLDLMKIVTIYKSHEMATEKIKQVYKEKIKQPQETNVTPSTTTTTTEVENNVTTCYRCGTRHALRNCPAWGKKCLKCQGVGHFTQKCTPNLAQKCHRPNDPNKTIASPFTQIDKKTKNYNRNRTSQHQQDTTRLPNDQIPPLMAPPAYTPYPARSEAYNSGYMRSTANLPAYNAQNNDASNCSNAFVTSQSTTKKTPLQECPTYSSAGSAPPLDSSNDLVTSNAQRNGSLYPNLPRSTSSSNAESITPRGIMQVDKIEITDATELQGYVEIGLDANSSRRPCNPPPRQPARPTTQRSQASTSIFSNTSRSHPRNSKSNETEKCIIS
ncbi:uncharacterized protein LOC107267542 isoform X2 [Cephus cinctus]|uniref:Uncharacterized protein LOC107267542 isoform X2 n=1 Tax=Cephus cinctus TaxID=211228 RepID=A0AAJ7FJH6_CEPCN|nr:uncharacterized protein LOC107267542 isoform X2 [Cephus cinctus]